MGLVVSKSLVKGSLVNENHFSIDTSFVDILRWSSSVVTFTESVIGIFEQFSETFSDNTIGDNFCPQVRRHCVSESQSNFGNLIIASDKTVFFFESS